VDANYLQKLSRQARAASEEEEERGKGAAAGCLELSRTGADIPSNRSRPCHAMPQTCF